MRRCSKGRADDMVANVIQTTLDRKQFTRGRRHGRSLELVRFICNMELEWFVYSLARPCVRPRVKQALWMVTRQGAYKEEVTSTRSSDRPPRSRRGHHHGHRMSISDLSHRSSASS